MLLIESLDSRKSLPSLDVPFSNNQCALHPSFFIFIDSSTHASSISSSYKSLRLESPIVSLQDISKGSRAADMGILLSFGKIK